MNKNIYNKKGFTLVELIAVLTILAVILLLVAPTVLNTIKKSEASVDKENIVRYGRAIKQTILEYQLGNNSDVSGTYTYSSDKKYLVNTENSDVNFKLTYEGSNIMCDIILVDSYGEVYLEKCRINNKNVEYTYGVKEDFIPQPDLYDGILTPVIYDGNNWIVANTMKKWYDYNKQEWANAVLLDKNVNKDVGDTVAVDGTEALAMYVWIPRFEYKIEGAYGKGGISTSKPGEIEINFILNFQAESSNGYRIHPAFTFGDKIISGIWVAKFELSHKSLSTSTNSNALNCSTKTCANANEIRILPNMQSLKNNNVSNFFYGIKSMEQNGNVFGIDSEVTDSHMIKNSEWGAVAYLSQSKYGKYGNSDYTGVDKEIYLNNSSDYYTGRSSGTYPNSAATSTYGTYTYDGYLLSGNTKTTTRDMNKVASTTGNIYGIYDMSGGSWEFSMGVFANSNGVLWSGYDNEYLNSGFTGKVGESGLDYTGVDFPNSKYYDKYSAYSGISINDYYTACNNGPCYGHALNETMGWHENYKNLIGARGPWLTRSGSYGDGTSAGIFGTAATRGGHSLTTSTRAVLVSNDSKVTTKYKIYSNGEVVYYDVNAGKLCTNYNEENSKTGYNGIDNKTGNQNSCLKFYAFNDDGSSTIDLVLDHNTTAVALWNENGDNSTGPTEVIQKLKSDTKDWKGMVEPSNYTTGISGRQYTVNYKGYTSRLITANEIALITGNMGWNENNQNTNKFYFDTNLDSVSKKCTEGEITECKYGWLYDRTSDVCTITGCLNNSDKYTNGYWTISSSTTNSATSLHQEFCNGYVTYGIGDSGRLSIACPNYKDNQGRKYYGVRPVIEVLKSNLQ